MTITGFISSLEILSRPPAGTERAKRFDVNRAAGLNLDPYVPTLLTICECALVTLFHYRTRCRVNEFLMKRLWVLFFILSPGLLMANVTPAVKLEIDHLLNFIRDSSCIIDRNGTKHAAVDAISHIEKKYAYFKDRVKTAEDFIEFSATKSTLSGKYYLVRCGDGEQIRTRQWLIQELQNFRAKN
jgi:hypothetical protein